MKSVGAPNNSGLSLKEYCVLATHTGKSARPHSSNCAICFFAALVNTTPVPPYISLTIAVNLFEMVSFTSYKKVGFVVVFSNIRITCCAISMPPAPPFSQHSFSVTSTPWRSHNANSASISAAVSVANLLMLTNTGSPKALILAICFSRLTKPSCTAVTFSVVRSDLDTPPCIFRARIVATITTASGKISP